MITSIKLCIFAPVSVRLRSNFNSGSSDVRKITRFLAPSRSVLCGSFGQGRDYSASSNLRIFSVDDWRVCFIFCIFERFNVHLFWDAVLARSSKLDIEITDPYLLSLVFLFQRQRWGIFSRTGLSAYGLSRARSYHLELKLNWCHRTGRGRNK